MTGPRSRGFTLIEVMIALAILAIALVVLLGLRNRDVLMQAHARDLTRATLLARQMALTVDDEGAPDLGYLEGDFGDDNPGFSWQRQVNTFMIERVREVRVSVIWGDERREAGRVEVTRFLEAR
jgi:general secretion pathway protein I